MHWTGPKPYCFFLFFFFCEKDTCDTAFEFSWKEGTVSLKEHKLKLKTGNQEIVSTGQELKTFQPPLTEPVVEMPFLNIAKTIQLVETGPFYDICKS